MKKSRLEKLDLNLYEETLDNGLRVFIVPKDNVNGIYATFSTDFQVPSSSVVLGARFTKMGSARLKELLVCLIWTISLGDCSALDVALIHVSIAKHASAGSFV